MRKDHLLQNIQESKAIVDKMEWADARLESLYSTPFNPKEEWGFRMVVNGIWLAGTILLCLTQPGWYLVVIPVLYWFANGKKVASKLNAVGLKKKLEAAEEEIKQLTHQKSEWEYELKSMAMIEAEYLRGDILKRFETYINQHKATTLQGCIALWEEEQAKSG